MKSFMLIWYFATTTLSSTFSPLICAQFTIQTILLATRFSTRQTELPTTHRSSYPQTQHTRGEGNVVLVPPEAPRHQYISVCGGLI